MIERISYRVIWLLTQQCVYSTILFIMIFAMTRLFKRRSSLWHQGLWVMLLIRLVLPPDLSLPFSGRNLLEHVHVDTAYAMISEYLARKPADNLSMHKVMTLFGREASLPLGASSAPIPAPETLPWYVVIFFIWGSGVLICLALYIRQFARCYLFIQRASPLQNFPANRILEECRARFRIRRTVRLVSSHHCLSPFTIGIFRPTIYLPWNVVDSIDDTFLEAIIAHELVHIKRLDNLWLTFQNLIQILYFFHPAVWYANRQINLFRECVCDSQVLSTGRISTVSYGESLLAVLRFHMMRTQEIAFFPSFSRHQKCMKYRLQQLKARRIFRKYQLVGVYVSLILFGVFFLPMARAKGFIPPQDLFPGNSRLPTKRDVIAPPPEFHLPVKWGQVVAHFGAGQDLLTHQECFYRGVAIALSGRTPVYAAADGIVIAVPRPQTGHTENNIILYHLNNYKTRYTNLSTIFVDWGQRVSAGDLIGIAGHSYKASSHLHFQIIKGYTYKDPEKFLDFRQLDSASSPTGMKYFISLLNPI